MNKKLKIILGSASGIAISSIPLAAVISCGNGSEIKPKEETLKILRSWEENHDLIIGPKNSKNYNVNLIKDTKLSVSIMPFIDIDAKLDDGSIGSLQTEWEKILGGKNLSKSNALSKWTNFINELVIIGPSTSKNHKAQSVPSKQGDRAAWANAQINSFNSDFWDDRNIPSQKDLYTKNFKKKFGTVFPSHKNGGLIRLAWAILLRNSIKENWNQAKKKMEVYSFVWDWNDYLNRRDYTVTAQTGAGHGLNPISKDWMRHTKEIDSLLKSYAIMPKLDSKNKNDFMDGNGNYFTFKNKKLEVFIESFMNQITSEVWYYGQTEYDNWYGYEVRLATQVLNYCAILNITPLNVNISKWMKPYNWFAPDPLYQHATPGAIYNSVPAPKTMNTGGNLSHYVSTSLLADLIEGNYKKAKRDLRLLVDHVWDNFTKTYQDGFKRDGGYVQHNVMPYHGAYGLTNLRYLNDIQEIVKGTSLDVFKLFPKMQNVFKLFIRSYIPLFFRGTLSAHVQGRMLMDGVDKVRHSGMAVLHEINKLLPYSKIETYTKIIKNFIAEQAQESNMTQEERKAFSIGDEYFKMKYIKSSEYINDKDGISQIWSNDVVMMNHYNGNDADWSFQTRFNDDRVGQFEILLGQNLQGFYIGDGMQVLQTKENPNAYDKNFWSGVDAYSLPGTVSIKPDKIVNPNDKNANPNDLKYPNEWVFGKNSKWISDITVTKTDQPGRGFSGGTKFGKYTNNMSKMTSYDGKVTHQRSVFTIGDRIFVLVHVNNPQKGVEFTIDNRKTLSNTASYTKQKNQNGNDMFFYHDKKTNEKIGYVAYSEAKVDINQPISYGTGTNEKRRSFVLGSTYINKDTRNELKKTNGYVQKNGQKDSTVIGTFNKLSVNMEKENTFAYEIIPSVDSLSDLEKKDDNIKIKVVKNDQYSQAIEVTNEKGEKYLMVNNFSNNNFATELNYFDSSNPVRLTSSKPVSMIFKKEDGNNKFEATVGDGTHDGSPTRISFGKAIKENKFNIKPFSIMMPENNPQYWTKKEEDYQNGDYVDDINVEMSDWSEKNKPSRVELARYSLYRVGEYFYRRDQIDFIPNKKYEYGKPVKFNFEFVEL